jgi:conserved oligomeric Golgi complex subunit 6
MTSNLHLPPLSSLPSFQDVAQSPQAPTTPATPGSGRTLNPFASKVTAVLSTSVADSDFRDALSLLDERGLVNAPDNRRQLRLDVQKELIDSNGDIIKEFGKVAEVGEILMHILLTC